MPIDENARYLLHPEGGGREEGVENRQQTGIWEPTPVPPPLLKAARKLRKGMTPQERLLWRYLRRRQPDGFRFRKQHPLGNYVLDFYCPEVKLAIEVDGSQHYSAEGLAKDAVRTAWLHEQGIQVLRFPNNALQENIEGVLMVIQESLHTLVKQSSPGNEQQGP